MGKSIREIISYAGYTVSIYFLCRYVNGDYGWTYKLFSWIFLTCTVLFFENNGKEVAKEISKSAIILICTWAIDICYGVNNTEIVRIFVGQIVWQLMSVIIVLIYNNSIKLHGKYALKLAMQMSLIGFCSIVVLSWNVTLSIILVTVYELFRGYVYYLCDKAEKREADKKRNEEEQEQKKKEQERKRREQEYNKEFTKMKTELMKYKQKERIEKSKAKRKPNRK